MGRYIDDPVTLDKVRREYKFSLAKDAYKVLQSKLRCSHFDYYRDAEGLNISVTGLPGYDSSVMAKVVYESDPVKFYKWWRDGNEDKVTMTKAQLYRLLVCVSERQPKVLLKKHREWLLSGMRSRA